MLLNSKGFCGPGCLWCNPLILKGFRNPLIYMDFCNPLIMMDFYQHPPASSHQQLQKLAIWPSLSSYPLPIPDSCLLAGVVYSILYLL
jgi:hypothetical protein